MRHHSISKRNLSHCNDVLTDFEKSKRRIGDTVNRINEREMLGWKCCGGTTKRIKIYLMKEK